MPVVQLIFILHVSTYRSVFPLRLRPRWCVSCPESCVWAGSLLSRSPGIQRREKPGLPRTDLRPCSGAELSFAPCWGQRSARVVPCQAVFASWAVGRLWERCSEGAQRDTGAVLALPFTFPLWHLHCCLSLAIQAAGQTPIRVVFLFVFCVVCGLSGFRHPEKVRGVCVDMI